jgi:hypothetical protein
MSYDRLSKMIQKYTKNKVGMTYTYTRARKTKTAIDKLADLQHGVGLVFFYIITGRWSMPKGADPPVLQALKKVRTRKSHTRESLC